MKGASDLQRSADAEATLRLFLDRHLPLKRILKRLLTPDVASQRVFIERHLHQFADRTRGQRVLDVGCGRGQYRAYFNEHRYESCDREDGFFADDGADFTANIMKAIPRPAASYDAALLTEVLEHVPCPVTALRNVARILRPRGLLFISVPQAAGDHEQPEHYFNFTQWGLEFVLKQAEFEIVDHFRLDGMGKYVGNRIAKFGMILYAQMSGISRVVIGIPLRATLMWLGVFATQFDRFDHTRNYVVGHVMIAIRRRS